MIYINNDTLTAYTDISFNPKTSKTILINEIINKAYTELIKSNLEISELDKLIILNWVNTNQREFIEVELKNGDLLSWSIKRSSTLGDLRFFVEQTKGSILNNTFSISEHCQNAIDYALDISFNEYLYWLNKTEADAFLYFIHHDVSEIKNDGFIYSVMKPFFDYFESPYHINDKRKFHKYITDYIGTEYLGIKRVTKYLKKNNPRILIMIEESKRNDIYLPDYTFYAYCTLLQTREYYYRYLHFTGIKNIKETDGGNLSFTFTIK